MRNSPSHPRTRCPPTSILPPVFTPILNANLSPQLFLQDTPSFAINCRAMTCPSFARVILNEYSSKKYRPECQRT